MFFLDKLISLSTQVDDMFKFFMVNHDGEFSYDRILLRIKMLTIV